MALLLDKMDVATAMAAILGTMMCVLLGLLQLQERHTNDKASSFLALEPSKRAYEVFVAAYTPIWIAIFGLVVVFQWYEQFDEWSYLYLTGGLALPLVLQPFVWPSVGAMHSPDAHRPWYERYSVKANVWMATYSFIGNYFYTHYFYSVLQARYTMPTHRLNNVPVMTFLATHFYFSTYHLFSNALLRYVVTTYRANRARTVLLVGVVLVFSYFTAFMETLTISSYPYYTFADRHRAYTVGSAFYGIYFLVSFPGFFRFDCDIDHATRQGATLEDTIVSACGHGMIILILLDLVRIYLGIPLTMEVAQ